MYVCSLGVWNLHNKISLLAISDPIDKMGFVTGEHCEKPEIKEKKTVSSVKKIKRIIKWQK